MYLCCLLMVLLIGTGVCNESRFAHLDNRMIEYDTLNIVEELSHYSLMECLIWCTMNTICDKSAWNNQTRLCQIGEVWDDGWRNYSSRVERAVGWTTYEKIRFSVSYYYAHEGSYELNFQEANETCIAMGSTMASPQTLLRARAEGFGSCGCGWLSDGTNGFVMQYDLNMCWGYYTTGIHTCWYSLADVFCNVPLWF